MKQENLLNLEAFFMALADKTRLRLLNLMRNQEICVTSLVLILNESQPKISRHLAYLRNTRLVETKREGKQINYYIAKSDSEVIERILANVLENLSLHEDLQKDLVKLEEINSLVIKIPQDIYANTNINYSRNEREELETFLL